MGSERKSRASLLLNKLLGPPQNPQLHFLWVRREKGPYRQRWWGGKNIWGGSFKSQDRTKSVAFLPSFRAHGSISNYRMSNKEHKLWRERKGDSRWNGCWTLFLILWHTLSILTEVVKRSKNSKEEKFLTHSWKFLIGLNSSFLKRGYSPSSRLWRFFPSDTWPFSHQMLDTSWQLLLY